MYDVVFIEAVFPQTEIKQCIIHQIGNTTKFVSYKEIKPLMADLLDDNPDAQAIVFANDDMAFSGYRVYEKRGHKVGKDLYEAKNTTRALSVELKMVARSATISVFKVSIRFHMH